MKLPMLCVSVSACLLTLACGQVSAGSIQAPRVFATNPAGICQSALPVFDGQIRKRPRALQNEGTTSAFVTCAFTSQGPDVTLVDARNLNKVQVYFIASDSAPHAVSCTGVPGYAGLNSPSAPSVVKSASVSSSTSGASMTWLPGDFSAGATVFPTSLFAISCSLDPGVGIADSYVYFGEAI